MKTKRFLCLALVAALATSSLVGCSQEQSGASSAADSASAAAGSEESGDDAEGGSAPEVSHDEEMTFEIYDVAANYQGEQIGWYGKVLKDTFNIKLNIIAPQVSGDANSLYQTRTASGNLGDIVILDNADMQDCIDSGLIMDISDIIYNYEHLAEYKEQIDQFNQSMSVVEGGAIYAIP